MHMNYTVGDKTRITGYAHGHMFHWGEEVVIDSVNRNVGHYRATSVTRPEQSWYIKDSELEVPKLPTYVSEISALQTEIYAGNVAAGWWENISTGERFPKGDVTLILSKLALIHSEVSEALEGVRKGRNDDHLPNRPMVEVELADAIIRILDLAGHEGYDVAGAIYEKLAYNAQRADHKKENRLAEGGKKA